jgi:hypothetical protein
MAMMVNGIPAGSWDDLKGQGIATSIVERMVYACMSMCYDSEVKTLCCPALPCSPCLSPESLFWSRPNAVSEVRLPISGGMLPATSHYQLLIYGYDGEWDSSRVMG